MAILCLIQRTTVTSLSAPKDTPARRILYASIPVFIFERVRKHTSFARDDKRLCLKYALTSRSFSGETKYMQFMAGKWERGESSYLRACNL